MQTVKINNKPYEVPELNFHHSKIMEQMGLPMEGMISKQYFFTALSAFVVIVVNCDPETADHLIEQHIMGGGNLEEIYKEYVKALTESGFFKKLLHLDEQVEKKTAKKPSTAKTE